MRKRTFTVALAVVVAALLVAAVPTDRASATGGHVHCMKYGETLYGVAAMYGTSAHAIAQHNGIYNPNYVRAGQCLRIPSGYGYGYTAPSYGSGYGYKAPSYDYGYGYKAPSYGHGYGYKAPSYGHGYGYKAPSYGYGKRHCVAYGETLYGIAYRYGVSTWSLANANGIYNPNYLRAGQCLVIPGY